MNHLIRLLVMIGIIGLAPVYPANAHSWYSQKTDPVLHNSCCGGHDCAMWAIQPGEIEAIEIGYRVRLSVERTQLINPYSQTPIDAIVIWDRVQPSEDGNWHLCIAPGAVRSSPFFGVYCLFAPPNI